MWMLIVGAVFSLGGIGLLFEDFFAALFGLAVGALFLYLGIRKKFPHLLLRKTGELKVEEFHLAGVSYYHSNIKKLATTNPRWNLTSDQILEAGDADRPIYRYHYVNKPVKLVPDPNNPHDKNAVAVYFAGELVGYISREQNLHVLDILKRYEIKYTSGFIGGGEYKVVSADGDVAFSDTAHSVNIRIGYV